LLQPLVTQRLVNFCMPPKLAQKAASKAATSPPSAAMASMSLAAKTSPSKAAKAAAPKLRVEQLPHLTTASYVSRDGRQFPLSGPPMWCSGGEDGEPPSPLMLTKLPGISKAEIETNVRSLWRYAKAFPVACAEPISLGEGCTPLLQCPLGGQPNVHFKCEWFAPTTSFKDRGTSVMLSLLRQQGVTHVLEDSSGNGGASVSAYAAAGEIRATIMAPASTSPAKLVQMEAHGARVELVPGSRQATADAAVAAHGRDGGSVFYASHNWHPYFLQGTKTLAYEVWEDLGFRAPRNIIIPTGAGSNILGCDIGFTELLDRGEIDALPRLFCAQPLLCSPIASAILAALDHDDGLDPHPMLSPAHEWNKPASTIAEGTSIARPVRQEECVSAVVRSGGGAVRVREELIGKAALELARLGLYAEPSSAQAAAAYHQLLGSGAISAEETTVIILTSTGVKATQRVAEMLGSADGTAAAEGTTAQG
jgi:threonine synthase